MCILDRPRHADLIRQCREAGARIRLLSDGDVAGFPLCSARPPPQDVSHVQDLLRRPVTSRLSAGSLAHELDACQDGVMV